MSEVRASTNCEACMKRRDFVTSVMVGGSRPRSSAISKRAAASRSRKRGMATVTVARTIAALTTPSASVSGVPHLAPAVQELTPPATIDRFGFGPTPDPSPRALNGHALTPTQGQGSRRRHGQFHHQRLPQPADLRAGNQAGGYRSDKPHPLSTDDLSASDQRSE